MLQLHPTPSWSTTGKASSQQVFIAAHLDQTLVAIRQEFSDG